MHYLGGKERIARYFAPIIVEAARGRTIWEPFCGGLSVSAGLARAGARELLLTDINAPLIALYQAYHRGWRPPEHVSEEDYQAAKLLPGHDPLKAFVLVGCSYAGKWAGGYARCARNRNYAASAANSLARKFGALRSASVQFGTISFLDVPPEPGYLVYCDPPYAWTTGYRAPGVPPWDPDAFWTHARAWAAAGNTVLVSEYAAPESARAAVVWERERNLEIGHGGATCGKTVPFGGRLMYRATGIAPARVGRIAAPHPGHAGEVRRFLSGRSKKNLPTGPVCPILIFVRRTGRLEKERPR